MRFLLPCFVLLLLLSLFHRPSRQHSAVPVPEPLKSDERQELLELRRSLSLLLSPNRPTPTGAWNWTTLADFKFLRAVWYQNERVRLHETQQEIYSGTQCLEAFSKCPVQDVECPWQSNCSWHSHGSFSAPRRSAVLTAPSGLFCSNLDQLWTGTYEGYAFWKPDVCMLRTLNRREFLAAFAGKKIVFFGDSMVRNIFFRLIAWFRSYVAVLTPKVQAHLLYRMNFTGDCFSQESSVSCGIGELTLEFAWAPFGLLNLTQIENSADVMIGGYLYWVGVSADYDEMQQQLAARYFSRQQTLIWINTPNRASLSPNDDYAARNVRWKQWIAKQQQLGASYYYFDFAAIFNRHRLWPRDSLGGTGAHFQCSTHGRTTNGDCRDMMNLNVILLLNHMLATDVVAKGSW